jgi:hypothetical protein
LLVLFSKTAAPHPAVAGHYSRQRRDYSLNVFVPTFFATAKPQPNLAQNFRRNYLNQPPKEAQK